MLMDQVSAAAAATPGLGARMTHRLLTRSPLGLLVRWVAGIQASVHAKLLGAFLLVVLLFIAMGALSLQSRCTDETGYVQPTLAALVKVRGLESHYFNNAIQSWKVAADGSVHNVHV